MRLLFRKLYPPLYFKEGHNMGFSRKYLSADGLLDVVRHSLRQEKFKALNKARNHLGTFAGLFEFVRVLIKQFVWKSFYQLWNYIGNPEERGPPEPPITKI